MTEWAPTLIILMAYLYEFASWPSMFDFFSSFSKLSLIYHNAHTSELNNLMIFPYLLGLFSPQFWQRSFPGNLAWAN